MIGYRIDLQMKRPRSKGNPGFVSGDAVINGDVRIGARSVVLAGAVLSAESGPVTIGEDCVVMENSVVRGVRNNAAEIGDRVLIGPRSHLSGCRIEDDCFLATGATVFNGAHVKTGSEVRINGVPVDPRPFLP